MIDNYDFSKSVQNPYFDKIKQQVTIPYYFKTLSEANGIPYQNLIHLGCCLKKTTLG
jgi:hypothetical protein